MDLQKHDPGDLIKLEGELIRTPDMILVKVPEYIYQVWCEIACGMSRSTIAERQQKILKEVTEWTTRKYPEYEIANFQDYSSAEAHEISKKLGKIITWGMYILLQKGGSMQPISITDKLLEL